MLSVFICEDNIHEKEKITECIKTHIMVEELCMEVVLSTDCPEEVLHYRQTNEVDGLYFLDMELNADINGLQLAEKIRKLDPRGFIVFITSHAERSHLTFKYKVEAMDYITKDILDISKRICECIDNAYALYTAQPSALHNKFVIKVSESRYVSLERSKILYFQAAGGHMVYVYSEEGRYLFYGELNEIHKSLGNDFFRCHKSVLVNLFKITEVQIEQNKVLLGEQGKCALSARYAGNLKKRINEIIGPLLT